MLNTPGKLGVFTVPAELPGLKQILAALLLFFSSISTFSVHAQTCPDLSVYYSDADPDWPALEQQLAPLMPLCLESAEYFALLGAAQLNNGRVNDAVESLERALLLDPNQGAAQIDYAQALFAQGQLFSALEMNRLVLERPDLPSALQPAVQERQDQWQALTRQTTWQLDLLAGYDNNLNGAPDPSQITLTLSGESVILNLNPEFQPISGPYANFRVGGRHRQMAPEHQHNFLVDVRGRTSEDKESDLLQLDTRYGFIRPGKSASWQLDGGLSHLFFGGSPLYTASEARVRYQPVSNRSCRPFYSLALQHQLYHDQSRLNAAEGKASAGWTCPYDSDFGRQLIAVEASLLANAALKSGRPGGHRQGWQLNLDWQILLPRGELRSQLNYTSLDDRDGYNPLLVGGADRHLNRSYALLQYRHPISVQLTFLANLYHQVQRSNIELFRTEDSTVELGLSFSF